jgi:hypothetical protein
MKQQMKNVNVPFKFDSSSDKSESSESVSVVITESQGVTIKSDLKVNENIALQILDMESNKEYTQHLNPFKNDITSQILNS